MPHFQHRHGMPGRSRHGHSTWEADTSLSMPWWGWLAIPALLVGGWVVSL